MMSGVAGTHPRLLDALQQTGSGTVSGGQVQIVITEYLTSGCTVHRESLDAVAGEP